jgi:hypothetical protein
MPKSAKKKKEKAADFTVSSVEISCKCLLSQKMLESETKTWQETNPEQCCGHLLQSTL